MFFSIVFMAYIWPSSLHRTASTWCCQCWALGLYTHCSELSLADTTDHLKVTLL